LAITKKVETSTGSYDTSYAPGLDFDEEIEEGSRNDKLFRRACSLRAYGFDKDQLFGAIWEVNEAKCHPLLEKDEVWALVGSAMKYQPDEEKIRTAKVYQTMEDLGEAFRQQLQTSRIYPEPHDGASDESHQGGSDAHESVGKPLTASILDALYPDERAHHGKFPLNDTGNAERLITRYGARILHVSHGWGWFVWDTKRWCQDVDDKNVYEYAKEIPEFIQLETAKVTPAYGRDSKELKADEKREKMDRAHLLKWAETSGNARNLTAMITLASKDKRISRLYTELDTHHHLLNAQNGTIDLRTKEPYAPKREDLITVLAPYAYKPDAACHQWEQYLNMLFCGDTAMIRYVQYIFGTCLWGGNKDQCLPIFHGGGKNGKSTVLNIARRVLGPGYVQYMDFSLLKQTDNDQKKRYELDKLYGCRLVIVSESNRNEVLAEGFIKKATGEQVITAEKKFGALYDMPLTQTFVLMSQHLPKIIGQDPGIWRRPRVITFPYQIPEEQRDGTFEDRLLAAEGAGIFR
jgi:putative DNA primase/helicase